MRQRPKILDQIADGWERVGRRLQNSPGAFLGITLGLAVCLIISAFAAASQQDTSTDLDKVKANLCTRPGQPINRIRCNKLFDALLEHPTVIQVERLRVILKEGK